MYLLKQNGYGDGDGDGDDYYGDGKGGGELAVYSPPIFMITFGDGIGHGNGDGGSAIPISFTDNHLLYLTVMQRI